MAKQQDVSKSQAIRKVLDENPKMKVKDVVQTLGEKGVTVSSNLVYVVKNKSKRKARKQRRQQAVAASEQAGIANPVDLVMQVNDVAAKAGGMKRLKALVDLLAG